MVCSGRSEGHRAAGAGLESKGIRHRRLLPGLGLCMAGILLMVFGALHGEVAILFQRAVRICLECIGIG